MQTESTITEAPIYQCRHIFTDGHRCGSRSLRKLFCFYHHQTRKPAAGPRLSLNPNPNSTFELPLPKTAAPSSNPSASSSSASPSTS